MAATASKPNVNEAAVSAQASRSVVRPITAVMTSRKALLVMP